MKKLFEDYGWLLKFILAAILLGVGIWMAFADQVVFAITGFAIVIFSLFRVIPLLKTLEKEILRTVNLIEIIFDTILGVIMVYVAFTQTESASWDTWLAAYKWMLAGFFYVRGVIFFTSTVFWEEKTEVAKFIFHLAIFTLAPVIVLWEDFKPETLGLLFLFISIVGAGYLGFDGYGGYSRYRQRYKSKTKKDTKEEDEEEHPEKGVPEPGDEKSIPDVPYGKDEKDEDTYVN
jgi:hypothetical protein